MKTNTTTKAICVSILLTSAVIANSAQASTKVKPPTAQAFVQVAWYQPVLDFFSF